MNARSWMPGSRAWLTVFLLSSSAVAQAKVASPLEGVWEIVSCVSHGDEEDDCKQKSLTVTLVQDKSTICGQLNAVHAVSGEINAGTLVGHALSHDQAQVVLHREDSGIFQTDLFKLTLMDKDLYLIHDPRAGKNQLFFGDAILRSKAGRENQEKLEKVRDTCFPE